MGRASQRRHFLHIVLTVLGLLYILLPGESLANYLSLFIGAGQHSGCEIKFVEQTTT